jgi:hypothetical protein
MTKAALWCGLAPALFIGLSSAAEACASCGCTLTADWLSQGLAAQPGATFSLRCDYIPQTTLRSGTHKVDRGSIELPTDREIEKYTYNHSVTATLDHQFANDLGIDVQLPFVTRPHSTIGEDTTEPSHSRTWRDTGPNSDHPNSGGTQVNVAPGLSAKLGTKVVGFGFVELPLYNNVNGFQLVPKAKLSLGLLYHI